MQNFQTRVVDEKTELDEKIGKLNDFLAMNPVYQALPNAEQARLLRQITVMREYSDILGERIAAFQEG